MLKPGDVFLTKTPDGRYAAVRVIRCVGDSALVCTSQYLGHKCPSLNEPLLRKTVRQHRFRFEGSLARKWLDGYPPKSFELLGNIPPTNSESKAESSVYGGIWTDLSGIEAFLEWRWVNDRQGLERDIQSKAKDLERTRAVEQKPKRMINEGEFWSVIDLLDWKRRADDVRFLAPAVKALATKSKTSISRFEERLAYYLYKLDTKGHALEHDPGSEYISPDGFLYGRCYVVGKGRVFYKAVLNDPGKMPKRKSLEPLLQLASTAYKMKTGEALGHSTGCNYESFSNPAGW